MSRSCPVSENDGDGLTVPRIKPLIYIPERECAYYCELKGLPYHLGSCPYSVEDFRGLVKDFLNDSEEKYPGIKFNVLKSYLSLRKQLEATGSKPASKAALIPSNKCEKCGGKCSKKICRACQVLAFLNK